MATGIVLAEASLAMALFYATYHFLLRGNPLSGPTVFTFWERYGCRCVWRCFHSDTP